MKQGLATTVFPMATALHPSRIGGTVSQQIFGWITVFITSDKIFFHLLRHQEAQSREDTKSHQASTAESNKRANSIQKVDMALQKLQK